MNYRKIERFSLISLGLVVVILFFISSKYALGFLLGGLAGLLGFKMIERLENIEIYDYRVLKSKLRRNHALRYLIYGVVLLASCLRPNVFSIVTCFIGLLLTKVWIVIIEKKELKED